VRRGGDAIAACREHRAAVPVYGASQDGVVAGQRRFHEVRIGVPQLGRPLDVREQKRDRARRATRHAHLLGRMVGPDTIIALTGTAGREVMAHPQESAERGRPECGRATSRRGPVGSRRRTTGRPSTPRPRTGRRATSRSRSPAVISVHVGRRRRLSAWSARSASPPRVPINSKMTRERFAYIASEPPQSSSLPMTPSRGQLLPMPRPTDDSHRRRPSPPTAPTLPQPHTIRPAGAAVRVTTTNGCRHDG
jgi:hypothetical protein